MRKAIYDIVSGEEWTMASRIYAFAMVAVIALSLVPLCFRETNATFTVIEYVCVAIFILDYLARWSTADYKLKMGTKSFFLYPLTPMAIIDLVSIVPFFVALNPAWRTLRITRLLQSLRAFRLLRYSRGLNLVINAILRQIVPLAFVALLAIAYVLVCAILIFNAEPETFQTYFEAVYWAVITLATVGYGDFYPVTDLGRAISIVSSFVGVAIVALPSSIITAGVMQELGEQEKKILEEQQTEKQMSEEPAMEEPAAKEPVAEEPAVEQSATKESVAEEPVAEEPRND